MKNVLPKIKTASFTAIMISMMLLTGCGSGNTNKAAFTPPPPPVHNPSKGTCSTNISARGILTCDGTNCTGTCVVLQCKKGGKKWENVEAEPVVVDTANYFYMCDCQ
ncbi:MAG TPA: hypothetical protein VE978_04315 [Chitinophagales bacterium]|nr:hypothetical protein [Chitinophagales bacterium]